MRLTDADLTALPCAAAWHDAAGTLIAQTPEWRGPGPGTVSFRSGRLQLFVSPDDSDADVDALTVVLLNALREAVAATSGDHQRRLAMLAAGLELVAGRSPNGLPGTTADVAGLLTAATAVLNPRIELALGTWPAFPVEMPEVVALALKQLVANAQRHDGATTVHLTVSAGPVFVLRWRGTKPAIAVRTSRDTSRRERWGLGYVWNAADALGGVALAPSPCPDQPTHLEASLDLSPGSRRLTLPVAAVSHGGRIERATTPWGQETGLPTGRLAVDTIDDIVHLARATPNAIVACGGFRARDVGRRTWVCLPPMGVRDRALDLLRGLAHEHDLLRAPNPYRTRIVALVLLLRAALGEQLPGWDPVEFRQQFPRSCSGAGVTTPALPASSVTPAPDPMLAAYLLAELGGEIRIVDRRWALRPEGGRDGHPLIRLFSLPDGTIPLARPR